MELEITNSLENLQLRAKKHLAKIFIRKLLMEDAVLSLFMIGFYACLLVPILLPLLIIFKPQMGIWLFLYFCWVYFDRNAPRMGGRKSKWFVNSKLISLLRDYFPIRLIKTADLPEGKNYILAHYPHSVAPFSIIPNFLSNCNKVADMFPGIEMHTVTIDYIFFVPILREFFLAIGACACTAFSFSYLLKSTPSKGIVVAPGGVTEIPYVGPDSIYKIVQRKGFIRLALATGSPLVPVFTFGEINTWTKVKILPLKEKFRMMLRSMTKPSSDIYLPLGRGLLPKRTPIITVVGAPIPVPKVENPSEELIEEYYEKFYQSLQDLFEKYKSEYDRAGENAKLIMIQK